MRKILFSALIVILNLYFGTAALAKNPKDSVFLKNGSKLVGEIIDEKPGQYLRFKLTENNIIMIEDKDIESVNASNVKVDFINKVFNITEVGIITGKAKKHDDTQAFLNIQTFFGYKWSKCTGSGIGVGVDNYESVTMIPVFVGNRGELLKGNVRLYYYLDAGYGIALKKGYASIYSDKSVKAKGGYTFSPGAGLKIKVRKGDILLSVGYKWQQSEVEYWAWNTTRIIEERTSNRMVFRVGWWL